MGPGYWWGHEGFFGMPVVGTIFGIIFWLLVLYALFVLVANFVKRGAGPAQKEETAMDILKKRYARGEIDAEEFARKKKDLES
jgi:putative membrane protein